MGLDITAYRGLSKAPEGEGRDAHGEVDYAAGYESISDNDAPFATRANDVPPGVYRAEETMGFRAGSYGGYNAWRDQLAALAGHGSAGRVWREVASAGGAFVELINFSDCEGTLGTAVSAKLAKDFADFQAKADSHPSEQFRYLYASWRTACEMAADRGAISFH